MFARNVGVSQRAEVTTYNTTTRVVADSQLTLLLLLLLLLLLVFSPWAGLGRDQSSVRRLVWLWYAASWTSS